MSCRLITYSFYYLCASICDFVLDACPVLSSSSSSMDAEPSIAKLCEELSTKPLSIRRKRTLATSPLLTEPGPFSALPSTGFVLPITKGSDPISTLSPHWSRPVLRREPLQRPSPKSLFSSEEELNTYNTSFMDGGINHRGSFGFGDPLARERQELRIVKARLQTMTESSPSLTSRWPPTNGGTTIKENETSSSTTFDETFALLPNF